MIKLISYLKCILLNNLTRIHKIIKSRFGICKLIIIIIPTIWSTKIRRNVINLLSNS